jgi:hypothetical protein
VSARHLRARPDEHRALSRPHGYDRIPPQVDTGGVETGALAARGEYAESAWGFWPPYRGSETTLQITAANALAPGERFDLSAVQDGLGDVLRLAERPILDAGVLDAHSHLCVCQSATSADGVWLAQLLAQPGISDERPTRAWIRRQTLRVLARCIQLTEVQEVSQDVPRFLAADSVVNSDSVLNGTLITAQWRGLILRNYSVGAWRELWAWLVNGIDGLTSQATLGDQFADALPDQTVGSFSDNLPPTQTADGQPGWISITTACCTSGVPGAGRSLPQRRPSTRFPVRVLLPSWLPTPRPSGRSASATRLGRGQFMARDDLIGGAALRQSRPAAHAARWLQWRRRHQALSRWFHKRARLARDHALVS